MKISGVIIIRNAVINDYPVVEAISSILPMVDEMIVSIDKGEDTTEELIQSIPSGKIRIVYSRWDMNLRKGGAVYAVETNKAMQQVSADSDWIFYIQADEIIHEKYHDVIVKTAETYKHHPKVEGLLFRYLHFYGSYDYVGNSRKWYNYEVRLIKRDPSIQSYKDAQGFRKNGEKLKVVPVDAEVYHYGWVKSPEQMRQKQKNVLRYYKENEVELESLLQNLDLFDYNDFDSLGRFTETHPQVMLQRIQAKNWQVDFDISKKRFTLKDWLLYQFEKHTGKRLFAFKNYRIITP